MGIKFNVFTGNLDVVGRTFYGEDGTLTDNRIVTQDGNSLTIEGGEFEQSRDSGTVIRKIQNNINIGGNGFDGVGFYQESANFQSALFAGDTSLTGGSLDTANIIVINKDFLTNGLSQLSQVIATPIETQFQYGTANSIAEVRASDDFLNMRAAGSGGVAEVNLTSTAGVDIKYAGSNPLSGIKLTSQNLATPETAMLGIRPDGYIEKVGTNIPAFDRQIIDLVANTPLTISSSAISDIYSIQAYDSAGEKIELRIAKTANANERVLESNTSLTEVTIDLTGVL